MVAKTKTHECIHCTRAILYNGTLFSVKVNVRFRMKDGNSVFG